MNKLSWFLGVFTAQSWNPFLGFGATKFKTLETRSNGIPDHVVPNNGTTTHLAIKQMITKTIDLAATRPLFL